MATYNLNYSNFESLLDKSYSPGTEHAIIEAIKNAGMITPGARHIGVEVQDHSGAYTMPSGAQVFLDTGSNNQINLTTDGGILIAAGDGNVSLTDKGPGGDTLVGGAGAELLQVTRGENLLTAGSGENTLVGGSGNDTLIGGGSSLLEAGTGGSTLIGGLSQQGESYGDGEDRHGHRDDRHDRRGDARYDRQDHRHDFVGGDHQTGSSSGMPSDTLVGGHGTADLLQVYHGDNLLIAGTGHDTITGGDGHDIIMGGGHDTININNGDEFVTGGNGSDRVNVGLQGNDVIYGGHATTVHTDQTSRSIKSEHTTITGQTTITFTNHQVLTVQHVTIDFANGAQEKL